MQYLLHNIGENLFKSVRNKDKSHARNILVDELIRAYAENKSEILKAMVDANIVVSAKNSDKQNLKLLFDNIKTNKKLQSNLAFVIRDYNGLEKDMSFAGYIPKVNPKANTNIKHKFDANTQDFIMDTINFAFDSTPSENSTEDLDDAYLIKKLKIAKSNIDVISGKERVNTTKIIILTSVVTILLCGGAFLIYRHITKKMNENNVDELKEEANDSQEPLIQEPPIQEQQVGQQIQQQVQQQPIQQGNDGIIKKDGKIYDTNYL